MRAGWPFYMGVQSVINGSPNMRTLIGLGTRVAFVYNALRLRTAALLQD